MTHLLAVVTDRGRVRDVVTYALREARDATDAADATVRFLVPVGRGGDTVPRAKGDLLAARIDELVAETGLDGIDVETMVVTVETDGIGTRVSALVDAIPPTSTDVLVMPAFREFTADAIASALADAGRTTVAVERAPVGRRIRRPPVAVPRTASRLAVTFGVAFAFYLSLGDPTSAFDLGTGVVSAAIVTLVLGGVAFETAPSRASVGRVLRAVVFIPYLLAAVVRANLSMAAVVLDPRLPIDPCVVRVPAPEGRVARALLANSITLTPGTLTVDVTDDELVVHALTDATRESLEAGALARAVDFVVHGRGSDSPVDETTRDAPGGDVA